MLESVMYWRNIGHLFMRQHHNSSVTYCYNIENGIYIKNIYIENNTKNFKRKRFYRFNSNKKKSIRFFMKHYNNRQNKRNDI